jgi:hypothetical protein
MREISFTPTEIEKIRTGRLRRFRRRFKAPRWWEGHRIGYKVYPFGPGTTGRYAETMCDRGGGRQRRNPYGEPGNRLQIRGTDIILEIVEVALVGREQERGLEGRVPSKPRDRRAARAWIVEFCRVDTGRRPKSMTKAYDDLPAKAMAKMVNYAKRTRAEFFAALDVQPGDEIVAIGPGSKAFPFSLTVLAPVDGSMLDARRDLGGGDVREGYYDVDRHSGSLYAGPVWKKSPRRAADTKTLGREEKVS